MADVRREHDIGWSRCQSRQRDVPDVQNQFADLGIDVRDYGGETSHVDGRHHRDVVQGVDAAGETADHCQAAVEETWTNGFAAQLHHRPMVDKGIRFVQP